MLFYMKFELTKSDIATWLTDKCQRFKEWIESRESRVGECIIEPPAVDEILQVVTPVERASFENLKKRYEVA